MMLLSAGLEDIINKLERRRVRPTRGGGTNCSEHGSDGESRLLINEINILGTHLE